MNTTDTPPITPSQRLERYAQLREQKRKREGDLKLINEELAELEQNILVHLRDQNLDSVRTSGYSFYRQRELTIKAVDGDTGALADALRRARLVTLVGPNHQKLKAWTKERLYNPQTDTWEIDLRKLPPTVAERVELGEYERLGCRKA